ncbi:MAG: SDR family NAD(P)-dependent oxidoreductase [Candidatus Latescibacterota bacterium]|jgi:3-oxoacyl-[acyl-carrier protein] reductase
MSLAGRKALVTGARRNIGRGIALALAEAGCAVGIHDIERDEDAEETLFLLKQMGADAEFFAADLRDTDQVVELFNAFDARFGAIDILVNNAYWAEHKPFLQIEEANWDQAMDVCLKSYFLCSQQAAKRMAQRGDSGSIVGIASIHGERVWPTDTCYGVAKAGVIRLAQSMAVDLAAYGIRSNCILPGYMDTEHAFGSSAPQIGSAPERTHGHIPTRRYGTPEDIGRAVVFLCGEGAGQITGVALPVDGGFLTTGFSG